MDGHQPASKARQLAAAVIGNALEWYDFIVFGLLTVVISRLFFPTDNQYASVLLTTATFGVGFFRRRNGRALLFRAIVLVTQPASGRPRHFRFDSEVCCA